MNVLARGVLPLLFAATVAHGAVLPNGYATGVNDVAGFATVDDDFQHAMAMHAGVVTEIFFKNGIGRADVASIPAAAALDAYEAESFGHLRMLVVLQTDGDVAQVWFKPGAAAGSRILGNIAGGIDITGFVDSAGTAHAVVLTENGTLIELTSVASVPVARRTITSNLSGAERVSGFLANDDQRCVLVVGFRDGRVSEVFYRPGGPVGISQLLPAGTRVIDVGAFYTADDQRRHAIVLDANGSIREIFYKPSTGRGIAPLGSAGSALRVDAYATKDGWRHVILGGHDGNVRELAYGQQGRTDSRLATIESATPRASLVGPVLDGPRTLESYSPSPAGNMVAVAGDMIAGYAVSFNAGVWRLGSGNWSSLPHSPRFAQSISVDPSDRSHLFVGERDGDAGPGTSTNQAGLWESGGTGGLGVLWNYVLDPSAVPGADPSCTSQTVPAIFATGDGGALAATQCDVMQRVGRAGQFAPVPAFRGRGPFTGVAQTVGCDHSYMWARTPRALLWRVDNAATADAINIPSSASDGNGKILTIAAPRLMRGGSFGMAAYGCRAAFVVSATDPATGSARIGSLEFDVNQRTWRVDTVDAGDGTGLGGRVFIKAEISAGYTRLTSQPWALLMSGAQTLLIGTPQGKPHERGSLRGITWKAAAESPWRVGAGDHYMMAAVSNIHPDLWDAHISDHPSDPWLLIATDGGVSAARVAAVLAVTDNKSTAYQAINRGLTTQHMHSMELIDPSYAHRSGVVTASVDNDAWWQAATTLSSSAPPWRTGLGLADANYIFADPRVTDAAYGWRHADLNGVVRKLAADPTTIDASRKAYPSQQFRSEHQYAVVPRISSNAKDALEMVALARVGEARADLRANRCDSSELPADAIDGVGLRTVVVRTDDVTQHRSISLPDPATQGWKLEAEAPSASERLWVSRDGPNPTYFFYAENDTTGIRVLFRRKGGQQFYEQLTGLDNNLFPIPYCAVQGPIFPNPYDPRVVYGIGADGVARLDGNGFVPEPVLTTLVTRSDTYPFRADYAGDTAGLGVGYIMASRMRALSSLVDVAYDVADNYRLAFATAYGSVFYLDRREGIWRDVTPSLPTPATEISNIALSHDGLFLAFEGRSVWRVEWPELAPEATYFTAATSSSLGRLLRASGNGIGSAKVAFTAPATRDQPALSALVTTDASGNVPLPPGITSNQLSGRAVWLRSEPSKGLAPAFRRTVF